MDVDDGASLGSLDDGRVGKRGLAPRGRRGWGPVSRAPRCLVECGWLTTLSLPCSLPSSSPPPIRPPRFRPPSTAGPSNQIVLHENKRYYASTADTYGDGVEALVHEEDTQLLTEPIVAPIKVRKYNVVEKDLPVTRFDKGCVPAVLFRYRPGRARALALRRRPPELTLDARPAPPPTRAGSCST